MFSGTKFRIRLWTEATGPPNRQLKFLVFHISTPLYGDCIAIYNIIEVMHLRHVNIATVARALQRVADEQPWSRSKGIKSL